MSYRTVFVVLAALLLGACGGGGGTSVRGVPEVVAAPSIEDLYAAAPEEVRIGVEAVTSSIPRFGSVTQSSNRDGAGNTTDVARGTFDGKHIRLRVTHADATTTQFSTADDPIYNDHQRDDWLRTGYRTQQSGAVRVSDDAVAAALLAADWNRADPADYLTFGYWIRADELTTALPAVQSGAFVDGPELRGTATVPVTGSATYRGRAHGFYVVEYGLGWAAPAGTRALGEFLGDATLVADFDRASIGGGVANIETLEAGVSPTDQVLYSQQYGVAAWQLRLHDAPIDQGTFTGRVTLTSSSLPITSTDGRWGGRFSTRDAQLVAGTLAANANLRGGTRAAMIGAFVAGSQ